MGPRMSPRSRQRKLIRRPRQRRQWPRMLFSPSRTKKKTPPRPRSSTWDLCCSFFCFCFCFFFFFVFCFFCFCFVLFCSDFFFFFVSINVYNVLLFLFNENVFLFISYTFTLCALKFIIITNSIKLLLLCL